MPMNCIQILGTVFKVILSHHMQPIITSDKILVIYFVLSRKKIGQYSKKWSKYHSTAFVGGEQI